jgi:hypothetical protein
VDLDEHHSTELAGFDAADTRPPQSFSKGLDQRPSDIRQGSADKTGAPPLPAVGVEGELRN